jgi:DNA-binding winged helix-turn-helix (wHTH) protein/tetratricopeptide (TPR) repeat protein
MSPRWARRRLGSELKIGYDAGAIFCRLIADHWRLAGKSVKQLWTRAMDQALADPRTTTVALADTPDFSIRDLKVRPAFRLIERDGERHIIQPRVMQVLVALSQASPEVVSRDRLISLCWDGRLVGDDALNRCIVMLRSLARELGDPFQIENVARVGYRLIVSGKEKRKAAGSLSRRFVLPAAAIVVAIALWNIPRVPLPGLASRGASLEVVNLVEEGQTLLRTGNPQVAGDARGAFEKAVEADPSFAPAWVGLARAIRAEASLQGPEQIIAVLPRVRNHLRRAISLSPDLDSAHLALGETLGMDTPAAQIALLKAVRLNPKSAENQLASGALHRARGEFQAEIARYRQAHQLDPNWYRPTRDLAIALAEMGERTAAVRIAAALNFNDTECAGPQARIARIYGDLARSARCNAEATKVETIWRAPANVAYQSALLAMDLSADPLAAAPIHVGDLRPPQGRVWMAAAPSPRVWKHRNRTSDAALAYRFQNFVGAKMMLLEGREKELVAIYDSSTGLLGLKRGVEVSPATLAAAPIVAIALRRDGRPAQASGILRQAEEAISKARRQGEVPFAFDAEAAAVYAAAGNTNQAIASLERAHRRGWVNNDWDDLPDLRDEPAYASLHGDPRFESIAADLVELYARERRTFLASLH